jgi:SAM-dependent methyltransferase
MQYIMQGPDETTRLVKKTERLLISRHLDWVGLGPHQSLADFGCGSGEVVAEAARIASDASVVGIDADTGRLAHARGVCAAHGLTNARFLTRQISGLGSTRLQSDMFDHTWTRFFLEYQRGAAEVVCEMTRVTRPNGKVTLIDIEGNMVWHYPLPAALRVAADEITADLETTGFDPHAGARLTAYALGAGLQDLRHEIEPYHRIVGAPTDDVAEAWRLKLTGLRDNYIKRLFPHKAHNAWVFDAMLDFILSEHTMTWSLLHLVQGTKPTTASA